ncbi:uncharacterized protein LOC112510138 [Cynara cardunculus var. scolymus]|uniref:uncharacterized protein LOC112510138 n=1 Tax=Cynara cardunculus var. scolymus TaxID=59895 RepID=UPI000D62FB0C|nr:uncharacterized protein LOC112510138 [Cynara cardunculus var. scolymus]
MPSSSLPFGIRNQKPMKPTIIRKNKKKSKDLVFNKVVSYLLSDSYMYNPLISPQPTFDFPPPKQISTSAGGPEDMALPTGSSNHKFIEFLETDCYLYSPLLAEKHVCSKNHPPAPSSGHFQIRGGSSSTETQVGQMQHSEREGGDLGDQLRARLKVLKETVAYHESVNQVVH